MPVIEEIDESSTESHEIKAQTPFAGWLAAQWVAGARSIDLVAAIGARDHAAPGLSEDQARDRLQAMASHPRFGPNACEIVRTQCRKLRQTPPFPFAIWLSEQRTRGATTSQVLRALRLKPSSQPQESVTVLEEFQSQSKAQVLLAKGCQGTVQRYDDDGDALIAFNGIKEAQWVFTQDFPRLAFLEAEARWDGLLTLAKEEQAWEEVAKMASPANVTEKAPRKGITRINGTEAVAALIAQSRRVLVLAGAGISVACGLPTFRDDDLRPAIAKEFGLENRDAVSDIATFRRDCRPWFKWIRGLVPSSARPTQPSLTHRFVRCLEDRGKLLRMYTQNIDTLEQAAGITKVTACHGSFASATCIQCATVLADATPVNEAIAAGEIPRCAACGEGVMKPDVVLFGEPMPATVMQGLDEDTAGADLLLVMGTSLSVTPCSLVPSLVGAAGDAPRVLINFEKVGKDSDFEGFLPGRSDDVVQALLQHLGWQVEEPMLVD